MGNGEVVGEFVSKDGVYVHCGVIYSNRRFHYVIIHKRFESSLHL